MNGSGEEPCRDESFVFYNGISVHAEKDKLVAALSWTLLRRLIEGMLDS